MSLVEHAQRELALIGEDQDVADWFVSVVAKFAEFGHSGGSAEICIPRLEKLLRFQPLSPLTNDPAEWIDQSAISDGQPLWQSVRNPAAISADGGCTYYLVTEREAAGSDETTPLYRSEVAS